MFIYINDILFQNGLFVFHMLLNADSMTIFVLETEATTYNKTWFLLTMWRHVTDVITTM